MHRGDDLTEMGWQLATSGFAGHEHAVREVVVAARRAGLPATLTDILGDPAEPEVARLRAYGRVAAILAAPRPGRHVTRAA